MPEEHVFELLPAYVIGCLNDFDCEVVTEHLKDCNICRKSVKAYSRVLDDLPLRIVLNEPPPEIRNNILQKARQLLKSPDIKNPYRVDVLKARFWSPLWLSINVLLLLFSVITSLLLWRWIVALEG